MYHGSMVANAGFWADYSRRVYVRTIEGFRAGALEKIAPVFSGIAKEAEAAAEAEFERLGSMPSDPYSSIDMSDLAEWAIDHGIEYYKTMSGVRQGALNLLAVGLHHLFEQQQLSFLRKGLAKGEDGTFQSSELERRLSEHGVYCRRFGCAAKVYELRMAANTIKHGAGQSADKLAELRPDLFKDPVLPQLGWRTGNDRAKSGRAAERASSVIAPLAGDDVYVSERDLIEWCAAVIAYWEELSAVLDEL